jgi:hypothetical protein
MYHCYVKLDLDRGLGRFIGHPCGNGEEMITPQQFRRDVLGLPWICWNGKIGYCRREAKFSLHAIIKSATIILPRMRLLSKIVGQITRGE